MMNLGILGFAHGHVFGVAEEWRRCPQYGVSVVCGWDRDASRLTDACGRLGIETCLSADALLARADIDAVFIAAETFYHAELVKLAAQAKKRIVLYKPLALTLQEADEIVAAVEENDVPFTVAWQMRVDPVNLKIKELIDGGTLGRPYYFRRRHCLPMHNDPNFKNTWHVDARLNRDIFADDSAHPTDWLNSLFGLPETVTCELSTVHTQAVKNDLGTAVFKYPNGMQAEVMFCASCSAAEITTEMYFEKGALQHYCGDGPGTRLPHEKTPPLKWFREGDGDWTVSDIPLPPGQWQRIVNQAKPLGEFLNGERPPICTAREARDSLRMVLACYVSSSEGRRVSIDDPEIRAV